MSNLFAFAKSVLFHEDSQDTGV